MPKLKNHTGLKQGRLVVLKKLSDTNPKSGSAYLCQCSCGRTVKYYSSDLVHKYKPRQSCGVCAPSRDYPPEWNSYSHMMDRCYNPANDWAHRYGGRGITVSQDWRDDFFSFLRDMGPRPKFHSLDRIDNDGNYCKENCKWSMQFEQLANTSNSYRNKL